MITYFDTSAFVPLLVDEDGSALSRELWDGSDMVVTSRLMYAEAAAALAQASRLRRISHRAHAAALRLLDHLWPSFAVIEPDEQVVARAAVLAHRESLRGYDAVHCASAERIADDELVVASGDQALLCACARLRMATADTSR